MQWKAAGPALQKIRDEELKRLDEKRLLGLGGEESDKAIDEDPWQNGLVLFQRWMIRKAILDAYATDR